MSNINISALLNASATLAHRITRMEGGAHGSAWIFNQCMRAFDRNELPAQAVTFTVFYNAPVMRGGIATIDRGGNLVCKIG